MAQINPYVYEHEDLTKLEKLVRTQGTPFIDVKGEQVYYNAVFWLGEKEADKFMEEINDKGKSIRG